MSVPLPEIVRVGKQSRMLVDGKPFLLLGLQWACDTCFNKEEMNPLFAQAKRLGCNTAVLPIYWREVEPEPDRFDFAMLDERIAQCRENGLRLVLLWFATWKNAHAFYAPDYIKNDFVTYSRALDRAGKPLVSLCPLGEATWERDRQALVAMMAHLRQVDEQRTVIMIQLENEPGIMGSDRCYCPNCNAAYAAGGWEASHGADAAEAFSVASVSGYIDRLAVQAKAAYALPLYMNVWLVGPGSMPGQGHPSGGAVQHMLELALKHAKHLDLIGPDIYRHAYRDFRDLCVTYSLGGNPLYIAEHSTSPTGRAERNVFYAVGEHGAIGFDPWAIDSPYPERAVPPLVDPVDGAWGPQAYWLRDSYVAIGQAMPAIVEAQGTPRLFTFVQEDAETTASYQFEGCDVVVTFTEGRQAGRGMIIQLTADTFLLIGVGFSARFIRKRPDGRTLLVKLMETGRYEEGCWVPIHWRPVFYPVESNMHYVPGLLEPGVARVVVALE
jgi:hypothetical protein